MSTKRRSLLLAPLLAAATTLVCLWPSAALSVSGELLRHWLMCSAAGLAGLLLLLNPPALRASLNTADLIAIGLFLASVLLSTLTALHPTQALIGSNERGLGALSELAWWVLALAGLRLAQDQGAIGLWRWIATITLLLSLWAMVDQIAGDSGFRSSAALGNPLFLASLLATTLPLQLSTAVWPQRWLRWTVLALQVLGLLSTGGRAAVLAGLVGLLVFAACRAGRQRFKVLGIGAFCLVLLASAAWHWRPASVAIRAELYAASAQAAIGRETLRSIDGYSDPLARWRPLVGYGPESIEPALTRYRSADLNSNWHEQAGWDRWADRAHSRLLDRLLETGLLGLGAGLWLIHRLGRRLLPLLAQRSPAAPAAIGLLVWVADGMVGVPSAAANLVAALLLGCALALAGQPSKAPESSLTEKAGALLIGLICAITLGLATLVLARAHRYMAAESLLASTYRAQASSVALAMQRQPYSALPAIQAVSQRLNGARPSNEELEQLQNWSAHAINAAPSVPRAWLLHGQVNQLLGNTDQAKLAWMRGLSLINREPDAPPGDQARALQIAVALSQIGQELEAQGRLSEARPAYSAARDALESRSAPNSPAWWATLAWLRAREGDVQGAIAAYRRVLSINPEDPASTRNLRRLENILEQTH